MAMYLFLIVASILTLNSCVSEKVKLSPIQQQQRNYLYDRDSVYARFFTEKILAIIDSSENAVIYFFDMDSCVKKFSHWVLPEQYENCVTDSIFDLSTLDMEQIRQQVHDLNNYEDGVFKGPTHYFMKLKIDFTLHQDTVSLYIGPESNIFYLSFNKRSIGSHYYSRGSIFTDWLMYRFYRKPK
ncbi:hypothetical protein L6Q79_13205 [bacterium]|nr:hypothetical protein [bacterium]NUN46651.1 hypothetical protein [bacterium]